MNLDRRYKIYFFDFFGTIMNRKCSGEDIKKIWSNQLAFILNNKLSSRELYNLRISAEHYVCKKEKHFEFTYKELIAEIYKRINVLEEYEGDYIDFEKFYKLCLEIEIEVEIEMQEKNEEIITLIKELKNYGKKVYILSDFYLDSQYIKKFLEAKGEKNLVEKIFVSCELYKNKADGSVYKEILSLLNCNSKDCCMIGDNYHSDIFNARKNGFGTAKVKNNRKLNKEINNKETLNRLENRKNENGLSYSNYSFMLFKFISLLYIEVRKNKNKKVFFLAREGEFLKKLFDQYCRYVYNKFRLPIIESDYLYVSRQATYPASLNNDINEENFIKLFDQYNNLSIKSFLINIGFSEENQKKIQNEFLGDYNKIINNFSLSDIYKKLRINSTFISIYESTIIEKKELFLKYLKQHNFFEAKSVAIVDVGWKGSIQDNIFRTLGDEIKIYGYYCGLKNDAITSYNSQKKGLIFSEYPYKSKNFNIWNYDSNFMERLLTASHASTRGYKNSNGIVEPVFNEFGSEEQNYKSIKILQESIMNQFKELLNLIYNQPILNDEFEDILIQIHIRCCCHIYKSNLILQQKLLEGQMENFGYQVNSGNRLKEVFSLKNIIKKIKKNYKLLKNIPLIVRVLNNKKLYFIGIILMRIEEIKLRKEYFKCKNI